MTVENAAHGFRPGGRNLDEQLVHGRECAECHDFLRGMSADRCCEWHYTQRHGHGWNDYRARRVKVLGL